MAKLYPDECPVFEIAYPGQSIRVGAIVEGLGIYTDPSDAPAPCYIGVRVVDDSDAMPGSIEKMPPRARGYWQAIGFLACGILPCGLRPLTPAAVAMLELVRP